MASRVATSMRSLLGGGRKYSNLAAASGRFHPNIGGRISIINGRESLIPAAGKSSLPLLLVPPEMVTDMGGDATNNHYNFMRIEKQDYDIHQKLFTVEKNSSSNELPGEKLLLPDDAICRCSSHGWLAFVHPSTSEIGLFNPLVEKYNLSFPYIPLPRSDNIKKLHCRGDSFDCFTLKKLALSSPPSLVGGQGDCNVVAIPEINHRLLFCKLGDSAWTELKGSLDRYSDVIYFRKNGCFYAMCHSEGEHFNIESWDFSDPCCPKHTLIQPSIDDCGPAKEFPLNPQGWRAKNLRKLDIYSPTFGMTKRYLVESSGDLLLVVRMVATDIDKDGFVKNLNEIKRGWDSNGYYYSCGDHDKLSTEITVGFEVYKMDWGKNMWEYVKYLGDKVLFVGLNHSFSVSTHDLPQVMENSIYFTDDRNIPCNPWGFDSGVYNLEDGFISGILPSSLKEIKQLPLWVLPTLS